MTYEEKLTQIGEDLQRNDLNSLALYIAELIDDNFDEYCDDEWDLYSDPAEVEEVIIQNLTDLRFGLIGHGFGEMQDEFWPRIDNSENFKRQVYDATKVRKYWLSDDKQASFGSWPLNYLDSEVWAELRKQGHDLTGTIRVGEYSE
jgi:hypothetical protein